MTSWPAEPPLFRDREDAGRQLAQALQERGVAADLVLAIPRGGVAVADPVARALRVPLDVLIARKVGAPAQPELAIGAVTRFGVVWNAEVVAMLQLSDDEIAAARAQAEAEVRDRESRFRRVCPAQPVADRRVVLVDDGWATGATAAAAVAALLAADARAVCAAAPVASPEAVARLQSQGADTVVLAAPPDFRAVGQYYRDFFPVTTDSCLDLLAARATRPAP